MWKRLDKHTECIPAGMKKRLNKKKDDEPMKPLTITDSYGNDLTNILTDRLDHHVKKYNKNLRRYIRRYSRIGKLRSRK